MFPEFSFRGGIAWSEEIVMVNDPIGDMLTQIRNAMMRRRESVELPHSKMKEDLAKVLVKEGYFLKSKNFKESGRPGKMIHLDLKYDDDGEPLILKIRRISKPGQRLYLPAKKLSTKFRGITVVSTSQGLMTAKKAREKGLGGELVCEVI
jgi:small subunit ribosomal protein S8